MVPRRPEDMGDHGEEDEVASSSGEEDSAFDNSVSEQSDIGSENDQESLEDEQEDLEVEYHTEESEDEAEEASNDNAPTTRAPLLPAELLKPSLPSPAFSLQQPIPWERMTREQKVAQRNRDRKRKKRVWDRLRRDSEGTGVLEAGKVAQITRGIVGKVRSGRVVKKVKEKAKLSGRQEILEQRKRDVEERGKALMRPVGKGRKQKKSGRGG